MPPGKNRLDVEDAVGEKRQKRSHVPAAEQPKDPDADIVDDEEVDDGEDEEESDAGGIRIGDIYIPPPPTPACTMESNGPRLVITYIDNINFKSYAGKQVLGPFHKSFTSIIGPNGSGKSNVIDSMLFVFGYRAQKIRSKSVAVLIHNSENYPNVQRCSVAVHFQLIEDVNDNDYTVIPSSQFVVARTAFKVQINVLSIFFLFCLSTLSETLGQFIILPNQWKACPVQTSCQTVKKPRN